MASIKIPNNVAIIKKRILYDCTSLKSVTIGNSVTSIGELAFYDCTSLTSITYSGTIAQYNAITKGDRWHNGVPATVVHCTDGDAPI